MVIHIMMVVSCLQSAIANEIAGSSGVMQPERVAQDVLDGVQVRVHTNTLWQCLQSPICWCRGASSP